MTCRATMTVRGGVRLSMELGVTDGRHCRLREGRDGSEHADGEGRANDSLNR